MKAFHSTSFTEHAVMSSGLCTSRVMLNRSGVPETNDAAPSAFSHYKDY